MVKKTIKYLRRLMKKRKTIASAAEASSVHVDKESNDDAHDQYFNENDSDDNYFNDEENNDDSYHYFNENDSADNNYNYLNDDINNCEDDEDDNSLEPNNDGNDFVKKSFLDMLSSLDIPAYLDAVYNTKDPTLNHPSKCLADAQSRRSVAMNRCWYFVSHAISSAIHLDKSNMKSCFNYVIDNFGPCLNSYIQLLVQHHRRAPETIKAVLVDFEHIFVNHYLIHRQACNSFDTRQEVRRLTGDKKYNL
jgi:hypothetical protein